MKNKFFTLIISVLAFAFTANAQNMGLAKKVWHPAQKIIKQNNHLVAKSVILSEDFSSGALPTDWQNIDNVTGGTWEFNNPGAIAFNSTTNANGFAIFDSDNAGSDSQTEDADLITKAFDCSGNSTVTLSFEHYFKSGYGGSAELFVSGDNGTTWTSLESWSETSTENAELATYDISSVAAGQSQVIIKWNWQGDYSWYWAIDDINVFEPEQNNLATTGVTPTFVFADDDAIFNITVKNVGVLTQSDFTLNIVVNDGASDVFTSTLAVTSASLLAGTDSTFTMTDVWSSIPGGNYTLNAYVVLTGDSETSNDTLTTIFKSVEFTYPEKGKLFGYDAYSPDGGISQHVVNINTTDGSITDIAPSTTANFLSCGDYVDGTIAGIENSTNDIYEIANDGGTYKMGTVSGVTSITGLAYDDSTDVVYVSDYVDPNSTLFSVNKETFVATSVGQITAGLIIGIAGDGHGHLWGINMTDHSLYSIDPTTGAGTLIGDLGVSISYAQDIGYDRGSGILYGTLYTTEGGLYTIDVTTGAATLVGTAFVDEVSMCAIVPSAPKYTVTFSVTDGTTPIDSANISVLSYTIMTDSTGTATIDLNNGSYAYTITRAGFGTINGMVTVADTAITVDVSMVGMNTPEAINFNVYPNPSNGNITISLDGTYNVSIMNTVGQIITTKEINNRGTIDLSNQTPGIYFISVKSNNNITTKRIVIE